eukprot:TRINITY_DN14832_c1_g2_i2.p1 TRINITY_DN14832_c1_g2~~TRINITY_DN14832_c1_g2_i2.p1  ORF type:complete len:186 (+),score=21.20 TRINITY_DN14832_c1_g2_i2:581-1138(+)
MCLREQLTKHKFQQKKERRWPNLQNTVCVRGLQPTFQMCIFGKSQFVKSILHGCAVNRNLPVVTSCSDYKVGFNMTPIDAFTKPPMLLNVAGHVYESSAPWKSVSVFQILSVHEEQEWMYNVTSDTRADEAFVEYSNGRVNEAALLLQDVGTGEEQVACAHLTSTIDGGFTKVGRVGQTNCILAE